MSNLNNMLSTDLILQIWGGTGYLLAKILLAAAEGINNGRKLRIIGWFSYLVGIPAWVIILTSNDNWVVAAIDIGSIPSMILGIVIAWKQNIQVSKTVDRFVRFFTFFMILLGTIYSIYCFHGITAFSQIIEILITFCFLFGTYLLAKNNPAGWLLYSLMCICVVILMVLQSKPLLALLQVVSFFVVVIAYIKAIKRIRARRVSGAKIP